MRGHIREQKGRFYIVVDIGRDHTNKRRQKWYSGYKTKTAAEDDLPRILLALKDGYINPEKMTFEQYIEEWLKRKKNSVVLGTYTHYESYARNHIIPGLGHWRLSKLEQPLIDSFIEEVKEKDLSQNTKLHIYRVLANAIRSGKRYGLSMDLLDDVSAPRVGRQEVECWTREEAARFVKALKSKNHRAPLILALATGMRYGEVVGLQWSRVDLDRKTISVTHQLKQVENEDGEVEWTLSPELKTETSYRTISIDDRTVELLKEHKKQQEKNRLEVGSDYMETGLVCATTSGDFFRPTYMRTVLNRSIKKAGIKKVTFHGLRHTHATLLLSDGVHPKIVQERLGHGSVQITLDTYSHVVPGIQEIAARSIGNSLYTENDSKEEVIQKTVKNNVVDFNTFI